jgi:hypothetical protein
VVGEVGIEPTTYGVVLPVELLPNVTVSGGGYRDRTDDPELAKLVLSQLS